MLFAFFYKKVNYLCIILKNRHFWHSTPSNSSCLFTSLLIFCCGFWYCRYCSVRIVVVKITIFASECIYSALSRENQGIINIILDNRDKTCLHKMLKLVQKVFKYTIFCALYRLNSTDKFGKSFNADKIAHLIALIGASTNIGF